jgi:hypothetical protein
MELDYKLDILDSISETNIMTKCQLPIKLTLKSFIGDITFIKPIKVISILITSNAERINFSIFKDNEETNEAIYPLNSIFKLLNVHTTLSNFRIYAFKSSKLPDIEINSIQIKQPEIFVPTKLPLMIVPPIIMWDNIEGMLNYKEPEHEDVNKASKEENDLNVSFKYEISKKSEHNIPNVEVKMETKHVSQPKYATPPKAACLMRKSNSPLQYLLDRKVFYVCYLGSDIATENIKLLIREMSGIIEGQLREGTHYVVVKAPEEAIGFDIKGVARVVLMQWLIDMRLSLCFINPTKYQVKDIGSFE